MKKQDDYLNQIQNAYNIPQSNAVIYEHQNLGNITENYQQSLPLYPTQPQVKVLKPQPNKIKQHSNAVDTYNNVHLAQPQSNPYQQINIQQNQVAPMQRAKVQPILQTKVNPQGQPIYQQNIVQNKAPQIDINLLNIQDNPFIVPSFEPNLQLANAILSEPQISFDPITTLPPENSTENLQANSEISPNAQPIKQQNNQKIVVPMRNPNTNIKQYGQSSDTHFVNTNEAKTNNNQLKESLNDYDRPTVGEGHGLFTSMMDVTENFDDNIKGGGNTQNLIKNSVQEIPLGNVGNNNAKNINTNENNYQFNNLVENIYINNIINNNINNNYNYNSNNYINNANNNYFINNFSNILSNNLMDNKFINYNYNSNFLNNNSFNCLYNSNFDSNNLILNNLNNYNPQEINVATKLNINLFNKEEMDNGYNNLNFSLNDFAKLYYEKQLKLDIINNNKIFNTNIQNNLI